MRLAAPAWALIFLLALAPAAAGAAGQSRVVVDELNRRIKVPANPQRIVALTPSLVEILFALGLGGKVVGATTWADYPPRAKKIPRVGAYVGPNLERILSLGPDLVLANREGNPPHVVRALAAAGIPVYITNPDDPRKLPDSIARLGRICGAEQRGNALAAELKGWFARVKKRLKGAEPVPTLLVIGSRPLVSVSPATFNGRLLAMAGARNIAPAGSAKWPRLSMEYVLTHRPGVVVVSTMERGQMLSRDMAAWRNTPGLKGTPGYRVVFIQSDLIDRPGPRLGRGLWMLAALLHPGLFAPAKVKP